jgi:penicillin-binding protein 1A
MADSYLTLFNDGMHTDPRVFTKITEGGSVLVDDKPTGRDRALSADTARQVKDILGQVVSRGSGTQAQLPGGAWGKTGTTDEYGDAWFVGASDRLTTAVWMGYPEGQSHSMTNVHGVYRVAGGTLPAFIFQKFMYQADPGDAKAPTRTPTLDVRDLNETPTTRVPSATSSKPATADSSGDGSAAGTSSSPSTTTTIPSDTATTVPASPSASVPTPATTPSTEPTEPTVVLTTPSLPVATVPRPRPTVPRPSIPGLPS